MELSQISKFMLFKSPLEYSLGSCMSQKLKFWKEENTFNSQRQFICVFARATLFNSSILVFVMEKKHHFHIEAQRQSSDFCFDRAQVNQQHV